MCHKIHCDILYISDLFVLANDSKNNVIQLLEKINIFKRSVERCNKRDIFAY